MWMAKLKTQITGK